MKKPILFTYMPRCYIFENNQFPKFKSLRQIKYILVSTWKSAQNLIVSLLFLYPALMNDFYHSVGWHNGTP